MSTHVTAETTSGRIRGIASAGVTAFKGIPYAAAPEGKGRFMPPAAPEPWAGVRDAFTYGARSLQSENAFGLLPALRPLIESPTPEPMSEDCLVLNVWTPGVGDGGRRPVMVWLHGGAFIAGSGAAPWTDGAALSRGGDAVVVTLNHRLGALGYLHLEDLAGPEFAASSLSGMLDIVAALSWVRDNVTAFGGDPGNVTLFGESGGGAKISVLMAMPAAHGLFHKAIIQSGPAVRMASRDDGTATAQALLVELGLTPHRADELRRIPAERLLEAQSAVLRRITLTAFAERRRRGFNPVAGQPQLPAGPFDPEAPAISARVPLMIGTNKDEMTIFFALEPWFEAMDEAALRTRIRSFIGEDADRIVDAYRRARPRDTQGDLFLAILGDQGMRIPSLVMADRKVAQAGAPAFVYLFTQETSVLGGRLKTPHTLEIPYVFETLDAAPIAGRGPGVRWLARKMSRTWVAFARTGDPNHADIPRWPAYSAEQRPTMIFDDVCRVENDPWRAERLAWSL
jgi:para-nitrobenzyl esterase